MVEHRGRPLGWVCLIMAGWVAARIMSAEPDALPAPLPSASPAIAVAKPQHPAVAPNVAPTLIAPVARKALGQRASRNAFRLHPALDPWQDRGRPSGLPYPALVAGGGEPMSTGRDTPPSNAHAPVGKAGQPVLARAWGGEVYAYSFWRFSTGGGAPLATAAQYGGSQSGLIGTVDPFGSPDHGVALLLRGAATPDGDQREVALGLRWRPDGNWPITLSAERRFQANAPDRFAAYLAGGVDDVSLIEGFALSAFGQAGYASGQGGGGFFDAQARVTRGLARPGGIPLSVGAGSWAGGQRSAKRLDVGPIATAKVAAGPATLLIQLDWRLRVAGNAAPKDGLALTLSTGF